MTDSTVQEIAFTKMHGAGNDYVFLDGFERSFPDDLSELAIAMSDRHDGIGSDGLIVMERPDDPSADVRMRMWNADGSVGKMCGNGARCVAYWMFRHRNHGPSLTIQTQTRLVRAECLQQDESARQGLIRIDMGSPDTDRRDGKSMTLTDVGADILKLTLVEIGNPHAVIRGAVDDDIFRAFSPRIEQHPIFPDRTNVEWVTVHSATCLSVRVWERGSGETRACGSGACAAVIAATRWNECQRDTDVTVRMKGGELIVRWTADDRVLLTGPARTAFMGTWSRANGDH